MEELREKYTHLEKALLTISDSLKVQYEFKEEQRIYYLVAMSSTIQRFEYTLDSFWKYLREYLIHRFNIEVLASPKAVFRECKKLNEINEHEYEQLVKMVDSRNLTPHAYEEDISEEIALAVPEYFELMQKLVVRFNPDSATL